jgi:hypothetical protein
MNKEATTQQKPDASLLNDARLAYSFVSSAGRRLTAVLEAASCAHYAPRRLDASRFAATFQPR